MNAKAAAAGGGTGFLPGAVLCILMAGCAVAQAGEGSKRFDGDWDTIVSCPNASGALGYSFEFPSHIKDGVLHGEKGAKGEPGWLQLDGPIGADGRASLYANGLVGASEAAVAHRQADPRQPFHAASPDPAAAALAGSRPVCGNPGQSADRSSATE